MTDQAASPTAKPMGVRDILRIRDYRMLISGQAISDIGDGITFLLLLLVINELTGSTSMLALMAIAEAVPQFVGPLLSQAGWCDDQCAGDGVARGGQGERHQLRLVTQLGAHEVGPAPLPAAY